MTGRRAAIFLAAIAGAAALACAGGPRPVHARLSTLCESAWLADAPDATAWIELLVRGFDRTTRRTTSPAIDCTDAQVRWDGAAAACEVEERPGFDSPAPLTDADVVVSPVSQDAALVWIATTRLKGGDALGPVALVARADHRLRVKAIGALRSHPQRASLRLETAGGVDVLVAEGDACGRGAAEGCDRTARVLVLDGSRFVAEPFRRDDGRCASPGSIDLVRRDRQRTELGWQSRELTATLAFGPGGLVVDEQLVVSDLGQAPGARSPRPLESAHARRVVRWVNGRFVASAEPLWTRMTAR